MNVNRDNLLGLMIEYEDGSLSGDEVIDLFQYLVDSGEVWTLQGHYGRTAKRLIEGGFVRGVGND